MAVPESIRWENLPDRSTPVTAERLNDQQDWIDARAGEAEAAALAAEAQVAEVETNILSWATSTPEITALMPYIAGATSYLSVESKLTKWWAALDNWQVTPAQALVIGDSITEGTGASDAQKRWQSILQARLRSLYGAPGALFPVLPGKPSTTATGFPIVVSGTTVSPYNWGIGSRTLALTGSGSSVTFTFTGTSCRLLYLRNSSSGTFDIVLDGGAPVTINSNSVTGGSGANPADEWDSGALTAGVHTVAVSRNAGSPGGQDPYIQNLITWNGDEAAGIRVLDGGRAGVSSAATAYTTGGIALWGPAMEDIGAFQLAVISLGTNDYSTAVTAAAFKTNIERIVAAVKAATTFDGSIVLALPYLGLGRDDVLWSSYGAALRAIAETDPDISYLDWRRRMPDVPTPYTDAKGLGLFADSLHPSDDGHAWIARMFTDYLLPRA